MRSPRHLAADLLQATGALSAARAARVTLLRRPALVLLCYHRVAPEAAPFSSLCVPPRRFEAQLALLARRRDVWPLARAADWLAGRARLRRDTLAITFDDGYEDNHEHAAPILERLGMPATFFVTTGRLRDGEGFWWDEIGARLDRCADPRRLEGLPVEARVLAALRGYVGAPAGARRRAAAGLLEILKWWRADERGRLMAALAARLPETGSAARDLLMTGDQVLDLARRGFEIGAHGVTHAAFSSLDAGGRADEARACRAALGALGVEAQAFAYPFGDAAGGEGAAAVRAAGFGLAVTTEERIAAPGDAPLLLPRKVISPQSPGQVATRIERLSWRGAA